MPLFPHFYAILLEILLFKMVSKHSAEVLSTVLKKKTVMCLTEKTCVLGKLRSGMSYGVAGCEFDR